MQISLSTEYAIHGLFYLALQEQGKLVLVNEIAKAQNISESYLAKIFQTLAKAGVVRSFRGARGGYVLAKNPEKISLRKIVEVMEGDSPIFACYDHKRNCSALRECLIKTVMAEAESKMFEVLEKTSLADLVSKLKNQSIFNPEGTVPYSMAYANNGDNQ